MPLWRHTTRSTQEHRSRRRGLYEVKSYDAEVMNTSLDGDISAAASFLLYLFLLPRVTIPRLLANLRTPIICASRLPAPLLHKRPVSHAALEKSSCQVANARCAVRFSQTPIRRHSDATRGRLRQWNYCWPFRRSAAAAPQNTGFPTTPVIAARRPAALGINERKYKNASLIYIIPGMPRF